MGFECCIRALIDLSDMIIVTSLPKEQQIFPEDQPARILIGLRVMFATTNGVDWVIADDSIASHQVEIASCSGLDVELGRLFLTELM